ncbi:Zinc finger MYND domain-containing protein 10 [Exaiptasia diaphana]|nr:Zinc finger MYND domain-containing protein 10 [Exaiptasia diaphana]
MADSEEKIKCSFCEKRQQFMKLCSRCRTHVYCSRECQVKDWPGHKPNCTVINLNISHQERGNVISQECSQDIDISNEVEEPTKTNLKSNNLSDLKSNGRKPQSEGALEENCTIAFEDIDTTQSQNSIVIFIKHNKVKSPLELKMPQDSAFLFQKISDFVRIPVSKLKLVCKGKIITMENISSSVHHKAVFLALGEVSECEDGLDKGDIETLMRQLNIERNIAVRALKKTGSLLDAIFDVGNNL